MAERPVFVPATNGSVLVQEVPVRFSWHPGLSAAQKKRNVAELHHAAKERGLSPLLEVSTKSEREAGQRLSAFNLKIAVRGELIPIECAFQGSKVFEHGGPFTDLYQATSREAKRDERLRQSGRLIAFEFEGQRFPINPTTVFYDWLYVQALYPHREWLKRLQQCAGFTDIEFNPARSLNCQARSCALFISLQKRNLLDDARRSFDSFRALLQSSLL